MGLVMAVISLGMNEGCLSLTTVEQGPGGSGGSGGTGGSGTAGNGMVTCATVQDCPNVTICTTMKCVEGSCIAGFVPPELPCDDNRVCDGAGSCVRCVTNNDCDGIGAACENNECLSCSDGIKNGDETDVDCGGPKCNPCGASPCTLMSDCFAGYYCVDGFCCDALCTGVCKACNLPGSVGTCSTVPNGSEDPGTCDTTEACIGIGGGCALKDGQPCQKNIECLSALCVMGTCTPN